MFKIRYAENSDKSFWFSLDRHMRESEFDIKIRDKRCYVIGDGEKPIGIMRYNFFWDNSPFLTLIYLEEPYRSKGFGREAMKDWENEMLALGHPMAMTSTQADEQAQHFYRKLGYRDAGCLVMDMPPFEQPLEIFMIKVL